MIVDLLAGVTQVMGRNSLLQFNYTLGLGNGYLTDPYKLVSVVGATTELQHESRPDERIGNSLYARWLYNNKGEVARLSYRMYFDDWGITSHTIEGHYRFRTKKSGWYTQPHLRIYTQSAANFYGYTFYEDPPLTRYASSDYRLGNLQTLTVGLHLGRQLKRKSEFGIRVEYVQQSDRAGWFENVDILVAQLSYKFAR